MTSSQDPFLRFEAPVNWMKIRFLEHSIWRISTPLNDLPGKSTIKLEEIDTGVVHRIPRLLLAELLEKKRVRAMSVYEAARLCIRSIGSRNLPMQRTNRLR